MALGRPKANVSSLPDNWQNDILNEYKKGASDVEIKALIYDWMGSFSNDLWYRWLEESEIFSETIKTGKLLSKAWWVKSGRQNLTSDKFSYTGWYMNMKNRFKWTDRQDSTTNGESLNQTITVKLPDDND